VHPSTSTNLQRQVWSLGQLSQRRRALRSAAPLRARWGFRFYLLSGALGGIAAGSGGGSVLAPAESGMSRQSNAYTKSPFEVFPIGKHNTGLPTLSIAGAGARFGVCANAGDERSTNAKDALFISTSRSARRYRRWPKPIPRCNAFCRRAPTERLVSFAILTTGVRAFE
jgi:hypothetical protein